MKKALILTLSALLLVGCGNKTNTYDGKSEGYGGEITVQIAVDKDGKVTEISVDAANETPAIGGEAAPKIAESIKEKQSLNVDTVSGATVTSKAVIEATRDALKKGNLTFDGM